MKVFNFTKIRKLIMYIIFLTFFMYSIYKYYPSCLFSYLLLFSFIVSTLTLYITNHTSHLLSPNTSFHIVLFNSYFILQITLHICPSPYTSFHILLFNSYFTIRTSHLPLSLHFISHLTLLLTLHNTLHIYPLLTHLTLLILYITIHTPHLPLLTPHFTLTLQLILHITILTSHHSSKKERKKKRKKKK
jgi:hypothetical protein